ncbi:MAG: molecular chaperone TorD family protein [Alcaligenaceae bacterium]|nr:molecular chaperone TorD family protein [Alcaligenaceae bacterium]
MYPEMQANWTPFNAERSSIFEWFSSIYADVITKDLFNFYCSEDMSVLLDFFVGLGFAEEVTRVVEAIDEMDGSEEARVALAEDFKTLFLTKKTPTAPPLASIYLSSEDIDFLRSNLPLSAFLEQNKLPLNPLFSDAEDHLSVYLAAISAWCLAVIDEQDPVIMESIAQVQGMYMEVSMLSWINDWEAELHEIEGTNFDFYQSITSLLCSFIELDTFVLTHEREQEGGNWETDVEPADRTLH